MDLAVHNKCKEVQDFKNLDWVDGIKGIAIISVILLHSLPNLREMGWWFHIGQAVPIFLFISAFLQSLHYRSFEEYYSWKRISNCLKRVLLPTLIVICVQLLRLWMVSGSIPIKVTILDGGVGPGSYYCWLFLITWLLLPFIIEIIHRFGILRSCICILCISIVLEYFCYYLGDTYYVNRVYRLLPIRYLMVLYFGCVYAVIQDSKQWKLISFGGICGVMAYLSIYQIDEHFCTSVLWPGYHWYTAGYVFVPIILLRQFQFPPIIKMLGKCSFEIFLLQMYIFSCL